MKANKIFVVSCILLLLFSGDGLKSQVSLSHYIEMAVDSNPAVQASYYEYLSVAEKVNQSGSIPDPTISVAYGLRPVETRLGAQEARISVNQMFPWFGTSRSKKESYRFLAESKKEQYLAERNRIILDVKMAWYALYENHKMIDYTMDMQEVLDMLERIVISKYENNQTGMVDVLKVQMEKDELSNKILQYEEAKQTLLTNFNLLINQPPGSDVILPDTLFTLLQPESYPLDSLLEKNKELKALKYKHLETKEMIDVARLNGAPTFGIGLDYSIISKRTDMDVANNGRDVIMPMASLKLPIYRKKYKSTVKENTIQSERIRYSINQVENQLIAAHQHAVESYRDADRKAELYRGQIDKADKALRLLLTESETGKLNFDDILKMEQFLISYRVLYEAANVHMLEAIATLEYLYSK